VGTFPRLLVIIVLCGPTCRADRADSIQVAESKDAAEVRKPPFSIVISSPKTGRAMLGKPLNVNVVVTNISDHDVIFPVGSAEDATSPFRIQVRNGQDKEVPFRKPSVRFSNPPKPEELPMGSQRGQLLQPGMKYMFDWNLQRIFALDQPGKYTVQARLLLGDDRNWIESNPITVTVSQR
jgi:hypothetical protein